VSNEIRVEPLPEAEFGEWVRLIESSPHGTVYAQPRYLESLCSAAGGRFVVLGARRGDELVGGVALYENDSVYGRYVAPRLLLYYNGPILRPYGTRYPSEQTARHLKTLGALERAIASRRYARTTLACAPSFADARPFLVAGWSAGLRYTYVVDIGEPVAQWVRVEQNLRRLIQRCEREGLDCVTSDDFDAFYALHQRTMARKGGEIYLTAEGFRRHFETLRREGLCRLFHARRLDGRIVASQLVLLGTGGLCHLVAAAADEAFLQSGASAFLRWKSFQALSAGGYKAADLTDAPLNTVTHFKSQLGGDLRMLLVLDAPQRLAYRFGNSAGALYRNSRAALKRFTRRADPEGGES
jgi:hypothetical protein